MLKENDKIAWRYKDNKGYMEGYIREINGKMLLVADSGYGLKQWLNINEIEIEILKKTD